jgi:anti-sigma regulatory factor (Ser/Thr protein kinase)
MVQEQREYDGDLRHLPSMRAFVREICVGRWHKDLDDENLIFRLELALTEAVSNIILHGFQGHEQQSITLSVEVDDHQACVTLLYTGETFDPQLMPIPILDGSRESGFGLYIIGKCVNDVQYCQDDQGRCVMRLVQKRE